MQVQLRNVQRLGNSYFSRLTIQKDLQVHYNGQKEISQMLETSDESVSSYTQNQNSLSFFF